MQPHESAEERLLLGAPEAAVELEQERIAARELREPARVAVVVGQGQIGEHLAGRRSRLARHSRLVRLGRVLDVASVLVGDDGQLPAERGLVEGEGRAGVPPERCLVNLAALTFSAAHWPE